MQNKYVGDIGDFGKYGLLREIFGRPEEPGTGCGLTLGVAWYLQRGRVILAVPEKATAS